MPYFLIHFDVAFYDASNGVDFIKFCNRKYHEILKNMKNSLLLKSQDVAYEGLTKMILQVALDH